MNDDVLSDPKPIPWWKRWNNEQGRYVPSDKYNLLSEAYSIGCSDTAAVMHAHISVAQLDELKAEYENVDDFDAWKARLKSNLEFRARQRLASAVGEDKKIAWEYMQATDPALKKKSELGGSSDSPLTIRIVGAEPEGMKL